MLANRYAAGLILFVGLSGSHSFAQTGPKAADGAVPAQLIGVWRAAEDDEGIQLRTTIEVRRDGTFTTKMTVGAFGSSTDINFQGTWKYDGKHVALKVMMSDPDRLNGRVLRFRFVTVDDELPLLYPMDDKGKPGSIYRRLDTK